MKTRNRRRWLPIVILGIIALLLAMAPIASAAGRTVQRPLGDFLSAQGSCFDDGSGGCLLFVPPDPNFLGWSTNFSKTPVLFAGVDYAGLANAYAPGKQPQIDGTVTERPLADGTAEVRVQLHTKNANVWVIELDTSGDVPDQIANRPTLFGHRPLDVLHGAGQALADSFLDVAFIIPTPGAPLPDLVKFQGDPAWKFVRFSVSAKGPLTAEFGVPEGTPGRATISQTGLFMPPVTVGDAGFPVENIKLQVIGK